MNLFLIRPSASTSYVTETRFKVRHYIQYAWYDSWLQFIITWTHLHQPERTPSFWLGLLRAPVTSQKPGSRYVTIFGIHDMTLGIRVPCARWYYFVRITRAMNVAAGTTWTGTTNPDGWPAKYFPAIGDGCYLAPSVKVTYHNTNCVY